MAGNKVPIRVTLDTNIPLELWKNQLNVKIVEELFALSKNGYLDLAVTTRISYDTPHPPLSERVNELPALGVQSIGTVFRWGVSRWGSGDFWGGERDHETAAEIKAALVERGLSVPEVADFDHIFGHYVAGRDVFLTWDKAVLRGADLFRDKLGVQIAKPEDLIADIRG